MSMLPETKEQYSSHIPALKTLLALGWKYLSPAACLEKRGGNRSVVLKDELIESLKRRRFEYKGEQYPLSPNAIEQIVRELSSPGLNEGLLTASERIYNKLCLGVTVTEFIYGKKHLPTIPVIEWGDVANNSFLVAEEMEVLSTAGTHTRRPDLVCFVNGLPLVVIEAKRPDSGNPNKNMIDEGISQSIRNQKNDEIPGLFAYAQLLLAISNTDGRYGTTKTIKKFWACWREEEFTEAHFHQIKNMPLKPEAHAGLFADKPAKVRNYFEQLWAGEELPTEQDRLLISLLTPERLLEFIRYFVLYDKKNGKIVARYPQAFGIKALIERINQRTPDGGREGGVLWHTTGSGKSFTMVFLCKALLLHPSLKESRIIVVTDRIDLEKQLANTFLSGGAFGSIIASKKEGEKARVRSGKDLAKRIGQGTERIIFSIINKFNTASKQPECYNPSDNLIVLIDEGHRSQGGENHERMRKALPNAAYIAFTGTPLLKDDKTTNKFGPILHAYTMQRAVEDGTVTPLLYEERQPDLAVNEKAIDNWFDKITAALSEEQRADLKKKFARKGAVYKSQNRIELIAWDIAVHFNENIKKLNQGLKGQIACDSKLSAIRYKKYLDETELVSSAVVISPPDTREGHKDVDEEKLPEVQQWWKENAGHDADGYERSVLDDFSTPGDPDLLIVVDKLLTGFDEPRNTVLYIDKPLKEHNLIQAIARVNRLHEEKQYGLLIDYRGILEELDTAIQQFQDLASRTQSGYDIEDIDGLYGQMSTEYKRLPRLHDQLWAVFTGVKNRQDLEQYRQILIPEYGEDSDGNSYDKRQKVREDFYSALTDFGLCLKLALSSQSFFEDGTVTEAMIQTWKADLRFFTNLRKIARQDAQETVDYSSYEEQIRRLVDKQVVGNEVKEPEGVYIVSELGQGKPEEWSEEKTRNETDLIRTRARKTIEQELAGDPYAQKVFSQLLKEAIAEAEALFDHPLKQYALFKTFEEKLEARQLEGIPESLSGNPHARAYYGAMRLAMGDDSPHDLADEALAIDLIVDRAVAEQSLNPQGIEAEIRKGLLPRLFKLVGMDKAKEVIESVIQITRVGLSRGERR
ncbi:MAG: HsdR family type I site-specific deoxyribonuclease [Chromatiales bacterium]|nr:type I restriction endonuclease subunit R [Gammaproteobacteria bacterium]